MPYQADKLEKEILEFWKKDQTFEKSLEQRPEDKPYVFYDGPPFATGTPHYGHFPSSIMKDVVPRYWTMNGYRVERVWGWDCHGLPIENIVEKELGIKTKKEIEEMGVEKFNELCRSKVLGYVDEWKKTIHRLGRWVDMENAYRTMDLNYMESVWWVFKELWDKNLIYEGYRSMHVCPRCETTLSQQEVSEGYKDVKDMSVVAKFKLKTTSLKRIGLPPDTYLLAWTTTPWTLPGNLALAVGGDVEKYKAVMLKPDLLHGASVSKPASENSYSSVDDRTPPEIREAALRFKDDNGGQVFIVSSDWDPNVEIKKEFWLKEEIIKPDIRAKDLVGLEYEPIFSYFNDTPRAFRVMNGKFVSADEGTGIVHIAPGYGQDDYDLGKEEELPVVKHVGQDGIFTKDTDDLSGLDIKPRAKGKPDEIREADLTIVNSLKDRKRLFNSRKYEHSYPHCWRCDTALINYATSSWFVAVTKVKTEALELAKEINWSPEHIKEGRFGKWLEGARDWSISRQRFWASVMPIWVCDKNNTHKQVFGSVKDLEEKAGQKITDLHKHILDEVSFVCNDCGGVMKRIPDVLDTWFDSGSMPYAQVHYPFENKEKFEAGFPAEFIAEGQDQTRAWFYYLHVLATSLFKSQAYKNVIVNGIVLAEDGKKMSKRLKNYPDPNMILDKYGADALRYFMLVSPVTQAENMNFSEDGVRQAYNKVLNTLWNVLEFYLQFAGHKVERTSGKSESILDRWIISRLHQLAGEVTENMKAYNLPAASRPIKDFIDDLSTFYLQNSRDRFKGEDEIDKQSAIFTLHEVLLGLSKIMAPFTPFIAEQVYQAVTEKQDSVHLQIWPETNRLLVDVELDTAILSVKNFSTIGLGMRKEKGINVRQPLNSFWIAHDGNTIKYWNETKEILAKRLNVKEVLFKGGLGQDESGFGFDWNITDELKKEGLMREVVRTINQIRKEQALTRDIEAVVEYSTDDEVLKSVFVDFVDELKRQTRTKEFLESTEGEVLDISGIKVSLSVKK